MNNETKRMIKDNLDHLEITGEKRQILEILCEACYRYGEREGLKEGQKITQEVLK